MKKTILLLAVLGGLARSEAYAAEGSTPYTQKANDRCVSIAQSQKVPEKKYHEFIKRCVRVNSEAMEMADDRMNHPPLDRSRLTPGQSHAASDQSHIAPDRPHDTSGQSHAASGQSHISTNRSHAPAKPKTSP
jgi:hypothetical protein